MLYCPHFWSLRLPIPARPPPSASGPPADTGRAARTARSPEGIEGAKDDRPAGYKERALEAIDDAIESLRINLAIREVDTLKGVERNPDLLRRSSRTTPGCARPILDLRQARLELESNLGNLREPKDRELRERALDDIDIALGHILVLVREQKK